MTLFITISMVAPWFTPFNFFKSTSNDLFLKCWLFIIVTFGLPQRRCIFQARFLSSNKNSFDIPGDMLSVRQFFPNEFSCLHCPPLWNSNARIESLLSLSNKTLNMKCGPETLSPMTNNSSSRTCSSNKFECGCPS